MAKTQRTLVLLMVACVGLLVAGALAPLYGYGEIAPLITLLAILWLLPLVILQSYRIGLGRVSGKVDDYSNLPDGIYQNLYERWVRADGNCIRIIASTEPESGSKGRFRIMRTSGKPVSTLFEVKGGKIISTNPEVPKGYEAP